MLKDELLYCAILIIFAFDVRFGFLTKIKSTVAKVIGWILRIAVTVCTIVILFFCGRVIVAALSTLLGQKRT